jgi:hypothetical protein
VSRAAAWPRGVGVVQPVIVLGALVLAFLAGHLGTYDTMLGLFAVLGLVFGIVVLRWPFVGLIVLAGSLAVENLLIFEGAGGVARGSRLLGLMVFGAWVVGKLLRRESVAHLLTSVLPVTAGLLFAFALASTLWARVPPASFSGAIRLTQFIALALLTFDLVHSWKRVDLVVKALVVGATAAAILTIEEAVVGGARRAGGDIAGGVNRTAAVLVTVLPFAFYLLRSQSRAGWRYLGITYIAVGVTATILTYSRMNLLVLPILLAILTFHTFRGRHGRGPVMVAAVVAMGLALYAIPNERVQERVTSIAPYLQGTVGTAETGIIEPSSRGYHLRLGLAIARDEPVIGAGYRNYGHLFRDEYQFVVSGAGRVYMSRRSPHSAHIGMLADLGGIGFSLWMALLLGAGMIPAIRAWRRMASQRNAAPYLASQAITYAMGLQVFVYGWYADIDTGKVLWILLGLAAAAWVLAHAEARAGKPGVLEYSRPLLHRRTRHSETIGDA